MQRLDDAQKRAGAFAARAQMSPQDRALFDSIPDQPWLAEPPRQRRSTKGKTLESRRLRCARMPRRSLPYRYVRRHGVMAVLDVFLSSGQVRTLQYLICRTGKGFSFTTLTSWIAADLGWCVRTIQKHLRELRHQGYVLTSVDDRSHKITITLTEKCEVAPASVQKKMAQSLTNKGSTTTRSSYTHAIRSSEKKMRPPSSGLDTATRPPSRLGEPPEEGFRRSRGASGAKTRVGRPLEGGRTTENLATQPVSPIGGCDGLAGARRVPAGPQEGGP